jgi:preprotein translocase subunit SecE
MAVAKSEKPGVFARVKRYFRNMVQEMKKVHWPDKRDLSIYTAVVIGVSLVISLFIWLLDTGVSALMSLIVR